MTKYSFKNDQRFSGLKPLDNPIWLASPAMHGEEEKWIQEAFRSNWVTTSGENIDVIEKKVAEMSGVKYAVALSSGTAALHLAVKLAGERLYGRARPGAGTLTGHKVFCSDLTFGASVNPVAYEGGEAVFIGSSYDDWNMDPAALSRAFDLYPKVKLIVHTNLYGTPGAHIEKIKAIADEHGALLIEDAAESFGAGTGFLGNYNAISFNGNKIITGSSGGMLLVNSYPEARKARKWSTQSREEAPWYQHEEIGYNYRMSNIVAGIVRGQLPYLDIHIKKKKEIRDRYREGFKNLPVSMNPIPDTVRPNYWLSCMIINQDAMAGMVRGERDYMYEKLPGKSSPQEILDALAYFGMEGRPIWKPMHLQPVYRNNAYVAGSGVCTESAGGRMADVDADIFHRGLCLPSDIKMGGDEQEMVIEVVKRCFWQ